MLRLIFASMILASLTIPALASEQESSQESLFWPSVEAEALAAQASVYFHKCLYKEAIQTLESIQKLHPDLSSYPDEGLQFRVQLSYIYGQLEDWEQVAMQCEEALKIHPVYELALLHYARALRKLGRKKEADDLITIRKWINPEMRFFDKDGLPKFMDSPIPRKTERLITHG